MIHKQIPRIVIKFGGTSVRYFLREAVGFVKSLSERNLVTVVVSALSEATDTLLSFALTGDAAYLEKFVDIHEKYAEEVGIEKELRELKWVREHRRLYPCRRSYVDHILSIGERVSSRIFANLLESGVAVDAYEIIVTDGNFGDAKIVLGETARRLGMLEKIWESGGIPVVTGFTGRYGGYRTTLGRNGSDYTATSLAYLLRARKVLIMGEVEGIYTADPYIVKDARIIPFLSYRRAKIASRLGMRAIHSKALNTIKGEIPIVIGRTKDWRMGTMVDELDMKMPLITHKPLRDGYALSIIGEDVPRMPHRKLARGKDYITYFVERKNLEETMREIHGMMLYD